MGDRLDLTDLMDEGGWPYADQTAGRVGPEPIDLRSDADDDLVVGSADPFQLFRILNEIVAVDGHRPGSGINFMLDQCHNIEEKIPG